MADEKKLTRKEVLELAKKAAKERRERDALPISPAADLEAGPGLADEISIPKSAAEAEENTLISGLKKQTTKQIGRSPLGKAAKIGAAAGALGGAAYLATRKKPEEPTKELPDTVGGFQVAKPPKEEGPEKEESKPSETLKYMTYTAESVQPEIEKQRKSLEELAKSHDEAQATAAEKYMTQLQEIQKQRDKLYSEYKGTRNSQEWARVADKIGQQLVRLFAASQGLKQGIDLSKIQIEGWDWDAQHKRLQDDTDRGFSMLDSKEKSTEMARKEQLGGLQRKQEREYKTTAELGELGIKEEAKRRGQTAEDKNRMERQRMEQAGALERTKEAVSGRIALSESKQAGKAGQAEQRQLNALNDLISTYQQAANSTGSAKKKLLGVAAQKFKDTGISLADLGATEEGFFGDSTDPKEAINILKQRRDAIQAGAVAPTQPGSGAGRQPIKKEHNRAANKTRITYSDGTQEIVDGLR